ncbi:MAG: hypothetical protein DCC65_10705 [Planctomycetota bacterium]|nr:MAG: hypothetical protein DCC65_10705 [Planctomycetota bacterium]
MTPTVPRTLYEVLGVGPNADDAEVESAYAGFAFGPNPNVPTDVTEAYRFLQDATRRAWYNELIEACERDELLHIEPAKLGSFKAHCDLAQITIFPKPGAPNCYAVRLLGQAPPVWTHNARPVGQPGPPIPTRADRFWEAFEAVFLFGALRRASIGGKLGLAVLYSFVIAAGALGIRWAGRELTAMRAAALVRDVQAGHAAASEKLAQLVRRTSDMDAEFRSVTGADFDPATGKSTRPRPEVDEAIVRHETVRDAWAALENGRVRPAEIQAAHSTLAAIHDRIQSRTIVPDDRKRLEDLIKWIEQGAAKLPRQSDFIKHIKTMVETDRFERKSPSSEGSGS